MSRALATSEQTSVARLVDRAAKALAGAVTAAQVLDARDKAGRAYDEIKHYLRIQKAKRAHDDIIAAAHRAQADALDIEAAAKRRLADEYDGAQERGEVASRGKPVNVPDGNIKATAAEIGLSRKDIHEARALRDVMAARPGIVREALDQLLAEGDAPTRAALKRAIAPLAGQANLRTAVGTASATAAERGNNLYETPPEAMKTLLSFCRFGATVWEPACGRGAIARQLEDAGYAVELSDLVDYSTADRHGELQRVEDFLATPPRRDDPDRPDIVTNPPYGAALNAFVAHALRAHRPRRMALLLNLNFLCGFDDPDRTFAMDDNPPARIYVFTRRLPMMHRDGWDGPEASSRMNTAWFVWELRGESYDGPTEILRVDWKTFETATPTGPADEAAHPSATQRSGGEVDWAKPETEGGADAAEPPPSVTPSGRDTPPPDAVADGRQALGWVQPYENGRILAMSGALEVGAIFPDHDKPSCRWTFFLGRIVAEHRNARTVDAAKKALTKRWDEWLAKAGLAVSS